jgi:3-oxoacyl-[acyl-carrier protein] reductase
VALVTGAARGIGEATARALAREGAAVIVMDRPAELEAAKKVADAIGGTALAADITDPKAAAAVLEHVKQHHAGLDIVVHNAGITRDKTIANMSADKWDMVLSVNLISLIRANEELIGSIRDGGRIIALSSVGGIAGNPGQTNYAATKAGVIGYVQAFAPRVAGRGITVNAVAPGFIETQMTAAMPMGTREVARRLCMLTQGGLPEDIAETITFLASPDTTGLTGEVIRICGGNFVGA